jgi:hypothetical protein
MGELELSSDLDYDILDSDRLHAVLDSAKRLFKLLSREDAGRGNWGLRESVWPALGSASANDTKHLDLQPRLTLVPLSRIGARGGFSGSDVLLAYFFDQNAKIYASHPLVLKLSQQKGWEGKLIDEERRAKQIRPYVAYYKESFAVPIYLDNDPTSKFDVLWSPFALPELIELGCRISLLNRDMRELLEPKKGQPADKIERIDDLITLIASVYAVCQPLHTRAGLWGRYPRSVTEEYAKYLRHYQSEWGDEWIAQWGKDQTVSECGASWGNPIWVLEKLRTAGKVRLVCGAVHGDLHPGNVLYSDPKIPSIIDFGWADSDAHLAKDYVLLECNLRFTHLPGNTPIVEVIKFSSWVGMEHEPPKIDHKWCTDAANAISELRSCFRRRISPLGHEIDWDLEYVIPLFLVSFGLLRFIDDYRNQIAARLFVLQLADYIQKHVLHKLTFEPAVT